MMETPMFRLLVPVLLVAAPAAAADFQNTVALDRAVASFTGHGVGEDGGARAPVDTRLKLAQCPTVALSWRTARHDAVVVECSGPSWRIFVPVMHSTPVTVAASAPVAAAPQAKPQPVIHRGDPIVVEAGSRGFSISREAIAMADAAPGERFMVKADGAKAPFQAVAVEPGRATLPGWAE
jgi:flagella basal body P-ring formation protein FlgA